MTRFGIESGRGAGGDPAGPRPNGKTSRKTKGKKNDESAISTDRTVVIHAAPETVFRFFTDSARWAKWWGAGSTIDPQPGGKVYILHPGAVEVSGEVLEINAPERIVFTYGFATGKPIPPGSSRVTILLEPVPTGTRLHLQHEFPEAAPRDEHVQGWRFQLSLFSNVVATKCMPTRPASWTSGSPPGSFQDEQARQTALYGRSSLRASSSATASVCWTASTI
jgi:uncharacterized protein YndB with AHSA1/START domain